MTWFFIGLFIGASWPFALIPIVGLWLIIDPGPYNFDAERPW